MVGHKLLNFDPTSIKYQCYPLPWMVILISVCAFIFLVMCAISGTLYRNRWKLRLWFYLRVQKVRLARMGDDRNPIINRSQEFEYDCFVSVKDGDDEEWVRHVLLPKMDNGEALQGGVPGATGRLCMCCASVHLIPDGQPALTQLANAITNSRKVMILLTSGYLKSRQLMEFELPLALSKVAEEGWSSIILVILEPGADVRLPHGQLHELLNNGEELKWTEDAAGQELFWNRLQDRLGLED